MILDNALSDEYCDTLVNEFRDIPINQKLHNTRPNRNRSWYEMDLGDQPIWKHNYGSVLKETSMVVKEKYQNLVNPFWHRDMYIENPRVKQYIVGQDEFGVHIDAAEPKNLNRMLVTLYYLNDVEEGGETELYLGDKFLSIKPKKGTVLCFPPNWLYPHAGLKPISNDKFIISSYFRSS